MLPGGYFLQEGFFYRYLHEYAIDPATIDFSYKNIHVLTDSHGNEILDIISETDTEAVPDQGGKIPTCSEPDTQKDNL